jgi:predicted NAD/FAD-dependent oxidoreductase
VSAQVDVVILGAGITGLTAGICLQKAGLQVLLLDKGFYPGGRVVSTRAHEHLFNPSVFRAKITNPEVLSFLESNVSTELRDQIQTDAGLQLDSHGRELALHLSRHLTIERTFVTHGILEITPGHPAPVGFGTLGNGPTFLANHALLTAPVPQSLAILRAGDIPVSNAPSVAYAPRLVVMCEVEGELSTLEEHPESRIIDTIRIEPGGDSRAFLTVYSRSD